MECQLQITVKVASRLKRKLGVGVMVDIQKLTTPPDQETVLPVRIKVYHVSYKKMVDEFFGERVKLEWIHNGKKI